MPIAESQLFERKLTPHPFLQTPLAFRRRYRCIFSMGKETGCRNNPKYSGEMLQVLKFRYHRDHFGTFTELKDIRR